MPGAPHTPPRDLALVAAGGMAGASLRYAVNELVPVAAGVFPWATFLVNISGSLALGVLAVVAVARWPGWHVPRLFLGIGVLGAFTTFSTFANETRALLVAGEGATAASYVVASVAGGLSAAWLGTAATRRALGLAPEPRGDGPEEVP
jgi:fluoride exporter